MDHQARYQEIAIDIAHSIVMGEYREGEKIHGRSTLAGRYNVSPETIRRSIAILQTMGVVMVSQGVGITVVSKSMAEKFMRGFDQKAEIQVYFDEMKKLMEQRREIDVKIDAYLTKIVNYTDRLASRWMDVAEIEIVQRSSAKGKTLSDLKLRERTGLTVVAVVRSGIEQFSPGAEFVLAEGDILLVVGSEQGKEKLQKILSEDTGSEIASVE
ncbi:transcriptional regulator [Desulfitobacterium dichloroeliminans LMG P-21439]|uniref:Transcriptional regulator n=1 Tax=Desulfitobacterium dichloroeliminans (strain LMG P-21439 / DCA1) TaxID=871963 RepID=L0F6D3_DESDL|nr:TrkA C-terminal domain-containing protein [Desulfitobacterium dichloroeliminans]AGA68575.1 transcriptional regulator [Desulfitobacterium dichloroeliminans LMG P-21439]